MTRDLIGRPVGRSIVTRVKGRPVLVRRVRGLLVAVRRFAEHRAATPAETRWAARTYDALAGALTVAEARDPEAGR